MCLSVCLPSHAQSVLALIVPEQRTLVAVRSFPKQVSRSCLLCQTCSFSLLHAESGIGTGEASRELFFVKIANNNSEIFFPDRLSYGKYPTHAKKSIFLKIRLYSYSFSFSYGVGVGCC